jgi:pyruvate/2-oxoglutarate dehydrogenase complex dihydrolipoamide acyltransferase (E2) component
MTIVSDGGNLYAAAPTETSAASTPAATTTPEVATTQTTTPTTTSTPETASAQATAPAETTTASETAPAETTAAKETETAAPARKEAAKEKGEVESEKDNAQAGGEKEGETSASKSGAESENVQWNSTAKKYRKPLGTYRTVVIVLEGIVVVCPYNDKGPIQDKEVRLTSGQRTSVKEENLPSGKEAMPGKTMRTLPSSEGLRGMLQEKAPPLEKILMPEGIGAMPKATLAPEKEKAPRTRNESENK